MEARATVRQSLRASGLEREWRTDPDQRDGEEAPFPRSCRLGNTTVRETR